MFLTRIVFLVHAMASSDNNVVGSPGKLLDVGTIVRQGDGAAKVADVVVVYERDAFEILQKK